MTSTYGQLLIRAALASPFMFSALSKLADWPATGREFIALEIPYATTTAPLAVAWQVVGSVLFIASRYRALGATVLAAFTAVATVLVHAFWNAPEPARVYQATVFLEHVALIAGLAAAAVSDRDKESAAPLPGKSE